jgi:hypothetical protein
MPRYGKSIEDKPQYRSPSSKKLTPHQERKTLNPAQKLLSAVKLMNSGHMYAVKATRAGCFMLMTASEGVFSLMYSAPVMH